MEKGKGELIGQGIAGLILGNTFEVTADDFEKNVRQFGYKSALDEDASDLEMQQMYFQLTYWNMKMVHH